jgi:hypothetical protein
MTFAQNIAEKILLTREMQSERVMISNITVQPTLRLPK